MRTLSTRRRRSATAGSWRAHAYGEVDRQQVVGEGQGTGEVHRLAHVAPLRLGDSDGVVGAAPLPHRRSHRSSPASWS